MRAASQRRLIGGLLAIAMAIFGASLGAERLAINFDSATIGAPPEGFFFATGRQASPGTWTVMNAAKSRHLAHLADPAVTMRGMSLAGAIGPAPADIKMTTRIRLIDGDRAGGLMWRYKDANNFYFMAVFLADRSASIIRVTGGNRISLSIVRDIDLATNEWHTLTVMHNGDRIRAAINGVGILRAQDRTLTEGGSAGLWSAGNSTTWFDDLTIEPAPE